MAVVFVYGTLTDRDQVSKLISNFTVGPPAVCAGLQRVDGQYPTLVPGGQVTGRLLETTEIDRLDRYEGLDRGLYCRVSVPLCSTCTVDTAEIYIGDPAELGLHDPVGWPEADRFEQSVIEYVETTAVSIRIPNSPG